MHSHLPVAPPLEALRHLARELGSLAALVGGALYLGAPLLIKQKQRVALEPDLALVNPNDPDLPPGLSDALFEAIAELQGLSFAPRATLRYRGAGLPITTYLTLLANPAAHDVALAVAVYSCVGGAPRLRARYIQFITKFGEDCYLLTSNTDVLPVFAPVPTKQNERFPMVRDAATLYRAHAALAEPFGARTKSKPSEEDPVTLVKSSIRREMAEQEQAGYFFVDAAARFYRPTWRGAYLMTWKLLFPVKAIRRALRDRRARGLLRELGVA
jgi:hypothetical protein